MIEVRNLAQIADLPFEVVADLPAAAVDELIDRVIENDPAVWQGRKRQG